MARIISNVQVTCIDEGVVNCNDLIAWLFVLMVVEDGNVFTLNLEILGHGEP